ncbi:Cytochrome c oxidase subunit 4 isoform 1, mitochondrial [Papilio xuthus]|uniref:Cytochrome c oxidase subunit 4 isoform 1, mitochondrial n=2 Tax=Papilio xuthus TaxID=66420 RepID=A0A194Q5V4_PAPXU|nr:Cytochrome c oxidase subunit 4 isoform 1, mitochondrial [Papilio xuthus]
MANYLLRRAIIDAIRVPVGTRASSELAKIGNREWVGYGYNGQPTYVDRPDFPLPAVRFRPDTPDVKVLREKEKGDWRKLTLEEKKALYRASFCQTFAEFQAPTGEWKGVVGWSLVFISLSLWIYMGMKLFVYSPLPASFDEDAQKAQLKRMLDLKVNPIDGLSSKWDYENNRWKAWNNRFYRENPAFLAVRVGSSFYNSGGERIAILEIYFHPDYNPKSLWNNICVLRLERHIEFLKDNVKSVKKIAIDKNPWNLPVNTPGITIIGWGAKSTSNKVGDPFHNILSYSHLDVYPTRECQEVYTKEYVTKQNFCGGFFSKGGGACNRDVGAPGIIGGTLVGVVSFGSPVCGTPDAPTVFTKVGYYYRWIENIMEMDVPRSKKKATTKYTLDPYEQYLTTTPATTIFKIEPLLGGKPPSVLDDTDYEDNENALRTLDDKLFQEFLETMFGSKEVKKYEDVIHQDGIVLRETKEKKTVKQIDVTTTEISVQPVTYAYDSDIESPRTQIIPVDTYEVTDPIQVTENIEVEESYSKYVDPKHKSKIERNKPKDIVYDIPVTTTEEAQEIYLELAPDSGKDSHDQSNQEQSIDNQEQIVDQSEAVSKGKESSETSSADISEIPGEEVIAELLDEIDFNQILREVSTDATIPKSSRPGYATKLERHRFLSTTTESANAKYYNIPREFKSADGVVESGNNSLLTLLYLSDGEKKRNVNKYNLNVEISRSKKINPRHFKRDNTLYNLGPKTELYRIISRVIEAAMSNQK